MRASLRSRLLPATLVSALRSRCILKMKRSIVSAPVSACAAVVLRIVTELHGEKIDIVRHSQDIKEYIQAALSPAEISQMQLIADEKRVNIIVDEDRLSLAIGKYGQNVRLASKLIDWELDIYSAKQWEENKKPLIRPRKQTGFRRPGRHAIR